MLPCSKNSAHIQSNKIWWAIPVGSHRFHLQCLIFIQHLPFPGRRKFPRKQRKEICRCQVSFLCCWLLLCYLNNIQKVIPILLSTWVLSLLRNTADIQFWSTPQDRVIWGYVEMYLSNQSFPGRVFFFHRRWRIFWLRSNCVPSS